MKLIITIANRGYCDELMKAARQAGAQGGTIVNGRGTCTPDDATFFGISLTNEKEILLVGANDEDAKNIVDAIKNHPALNRQGAGVVFTVNIEDFNLLSQA